MFHKTHLKNKNTISQQLIPFKFSDLNYCQCIKFWENILKNSCHHKRFVLLKIFVSVNQIFLICTLFVCVKVLNKNFDLLAYTYIMYSKIYKLYTFNIPSPINDV